MIKRREEIMIEFIKEAGMALLWVLLGYLVVGRNKK
jgi:hypothetical protein